MPARRATLKDIGIRWHYWLYCFVFAAFGTGSLFAIHIEPQSKSTFLVTAGFFFTISLLSLLWPILRTQEQQGAQYISAPSQRIPLRGTLFPVSKVKLLLGVIGSSICAVVALWCLLFDDNSEHRVKSGIAVIAFIWLLCLFLRSVIQRRPGILLSTDGVLWHDYMMDGCFVPWAEITKANSYIHRAKYNNAPSFGLKVNNLDTLNISSSCRKKMNENFRLHGWHLYYHAESLLLPLAAIELAVAFYWHHPEARWELGSGAEIERITKFEDVTNSL